MILGVQNLLGADLGGAGSFVYTVCDPQSVTKDFAGQVSRSRASNRALPPHA